MIARELIGRGRLAIIMMEDEEDFERLRVLWTAALAIARSVGHVLDKVDSKASAEMEQKLTSLWPTWKQEPTFREFIEPERNLLLKVGTGSASTSETTGLTNGDHVWTLDYTLYWPLTDNEFAGEDCRDMLAVAFDWWEAKLGELSE